MASYLNLPHRKVLLLICYIFGGSIIIKYSEGGIENQYIGCYYDSVSQFNWTTGLSNSNNLSTVQCTERCRNLNRTYAILQSGRNCLCGDNFNASLSNDICNIPCSANASQYCGGYKNGLQYYAIYSVCPIGYYGTDCSRVCHCKNQIPCNLMNGVCPNACDGIWTKSNCSEESTFAGRYIGCYRDKEARALPLSYDLGKLSPVDPNYTRWCTRLCGTNYTTYLGLQYYDGCFCGENYAVYGKIGENNCNTRCSRDQSQICGGTWANSVYSVCAAGRFGSDCLDRCNCKDKEICNILNGTCRSGCKSGWTGSSCSVRDCNVDNGDCTENESCVTVNLGYSSVNRCFCASGFYRNALWDNCTDLDECVSTPSVCNNQTETCNNTIGSFSCTCNPGFQRKGTNVHCEDIGECKDSKPMVCDSVTEKCINTFGGFECSCQDGYQRQNNSNCTDINECFSTPSVCKNETSTCNNTIGSFVCICRTGFAKKVGTNECLDIDECKSSVCDQSSTNCNNTVGGFACECKDGYTQRNDTVLECEVINKMQIRDDRGKIAGAVVGSILGLILIACVVLLLLFFLRKRRNDPKLLGTTTSSEVRDVSQDTALRRGRVISLFAEERGHPLSTNALNYLKDKLSDPKTIQAEFQNVPLKTKDFSALGSREEVKKKNRFLNIIPYDWNRVVLSRTTDDDTSEYINASYVQGFNDSDKFIAAQGPRSESLEDFWRMIIEKDILLIVMMTNLVESEKSKCVQYWPELGETKNFGDVSVTLIEEDVWPSYTVRRLKATTTLKSLEITQWHYKAWPDHGVPKDVKCFLNFHAKVRRQMSPEKYTLVHCSAGAGRTGAFISIDYLLEQEKSDHEVDVHECLKLLRDQRPSMIQNMPQYEFVHLALYKAFLIGDTTIPVKKYSSKYQSWQNTDIITDKTMLEMQFQDIESTKADPEETEKYRVWSNVVEKQKLNELDATYINSWKRKDAFIWIKLLDDSETIWALLKDQNSKIIIYIESAEDSSVQFLPSQEMPIALKNSTLFMESESKTDYGWRCIIAESSEDVEHNYSNVQSEAIYQNTETHSNKSRTTVFRIKEPNEKQWTNIESIHSVFNFIESARADNSKATFPVMVISRCSYSVVGFLIAILNAMEMIKLEKEIDLYQIVFNIRKSKPEFFSSMPYYEDLHDFIDKYIAISSA